MLTSFTMFIKVEYAQIDRPNYDTFFWRPQYLNLRYHYYLGALEKSEIFYYLSSCKATISAGVSC